MTKKPNRRYPPVRVGLFTLDSVNEMYAGKVAARTGDLVIAAPKLDSLRRAGVDAIAYDADHLRVLGDPVKLVVPGAARLQVAFGYTLTGAEAKALRRRGVIVCRRMNYAIRLVTHLLRRSPAAAA
jgi:hypothetical protein